MDVEQQRAEVFFDALDIAPAVRAEMLLGHRNSYKSLVVTLRKMAKKRGVDLPRIRLNSNAKTNSSPPSEEETQCPNCRVTCVIRGSDLIEKETGIVHYVGDTPCQEQAAKGEDEIREEQEGEGETLTFRFRESVARTREKLGIVKLSIGFRNDDVKNMTRDFLGRFEGDLDPYVEALIKASLERKKPKRKISIAKGDLEKVKKAVIGATFEHALKQSRPDPEDEMRVTSETLGPERTESFLDEGEAPADPSGQGTLFDPENPSAETAESGGKTSQEEVLSPPERPGDASSPPDPTEKTREADGTSQGEEAPASVKEDDTPEEGEKKAPAEPKAAKKATKKKSGKKGKAEVDEYGEVEVEGQVIRVARDAKDIVKGVFDSDFFEVVKLAVALAVKNHPALPDVITEKDISEAWVQYATAKMNAKSAATIAEEKKAHTPDNQDPNREYFSVSSITQFIRCPYQWYQRRVLKKIEPPSIALAFGSSFDEAANLNYKAKKTTMKDEPDDVLHDKFVESLKGRADSIWYDANPKTVIEEHKKKGTKLLTKFKADIMKDVFPLEVQEKITTPLQGVDYDLFSILDLTTVDGRVVDNKTSARAWHVGRERQELQRTMYALAYLAKYGVMPKAMEFHIAIKTKEPKTQLITSPVSNEEIQGFLKFIAFVVSNIRASVKSGVFIPRRDHNLCSTRYCGYFASCEAEWGWKVYEPKKN